MELVARFKERRPEYAAEHHDMIMRFTLEQGGQAGTRARSETFAEGRFFSTRYEIFMYAALLGLKRDLRIPISSDTDRRHFNEIKNWQPTEVVDYIIMALLAKADIDFIVLENLEEKEIERKLGEIRSLLEAYANGGFDIIRARREEDEAFFRDNENCFLDLMSEN